LRLNKYIVAVVVGLELFLFMYERISEVDIERPFKKETDSATKILFLGDIMLGRAVENLQNGHGNDYPFSKVGEFLKKYDVVVANLEGPIMAHHVQTPLFSTRFSFVSSTPKLLKKYNIGIVSLANNHTSDYGLSGLEDTRKSLMAEGIIGVGGSGEDEYSLQKIMINNTSVAILALNSVFHTPDRQKIKNIISTVEKEMTVIVLVHWGDEYIPLSNRRERELAHFLIDEGADLIIGHHPHVVQEVERYNGKIIFYSLGNFIFDQYFSKETQEGIAVEFVIDNEDVSYKIYPFESNKSMPELLVDDRQEWIEEFSKRIRTIERGELIGKIQTQK